MKRRIISQRPSRTIPGCDDITWVSEEPTMWINWPLDPPPKIETEWVIVYKDGTRDKVEDLKEIKGPIKELYLRVTTE